ncbi:hypothetical protein BD309DRAFT_1019020 [Dichomitus squalens]|nr:hypothetical protein BD311DRAFT_765841 [Dichomitus squalens]TBU43798.1 hypothetical protein BD309DRAFT_1019020 [Dichomitus squalens]
MNLLPRVSLHPDVVEAVASEEQESVWERLTSALCGWCGKGGLNKQLKRCGGCGVVFYCKKECQAAAWPKHKVVCRSKRTIDLNPKAAGFATPMKLVASIVDWAEVHKYALTIMAHALVRLDGGVDYNLKNGRVLVYVVSPNHGEDHPSRAFSLMMVKLTDMEDCTDIYQRWRESPMSNVKPEGPFFQSGNTSATPAGVIPATFIVGPSKPGGPPGSTIFTQSQYPLYPPSCHADSAPLDEPTADAFYDVMGVVEGFMTLDVVFRPPPGGVQKDNQAVAGQLARKGKGWRWERVMGAWLELDEILAEDFPPPKSGKSALELWTLFRSW